MRSRRKVFDRTESLAVLADLTIFVDRLPLTRTRHHPRHLNPYCAEGGIKYARPPVFDPAVAAAFGAWASVGIIGLDLILDYGAL
jgi:hypothetical protein